MFEPFPKKEHESHDAVISGMWKDGSSVLSSFKYTLNHFYFPQIIWLGRESTIEITYLNNLVINSLVFFCYYSFEQWKLQVSKCTRKIKEGWPELTYFYEYIDQINCLISLIFVEHSL